MKRLLALIIAFLLATMLFSCEKDLKDDNTSAELPTEEQTTIPPIIYITDDSGNIINAVDKPIIYLYPEEVTLIHRRCKADCNTRARQYAASLYGIQAA